MSREALEAIIGRAIIDAGFRLALFADPDATLAEYELTEDEVAALKMLDAESLDAFAQVSARRIARKLQDTPQHPHEEGKMKAKLLTIAVIVLLLSLLIACVSPMPAAAPPTPVATAVPPTPIPPPPPTTTPLASAEPGPIRLANAYVAAMNRRNVEEALTMFTDDGVYAVAVQTSTGKSQVRTYFEYMDAIRMRVTQSDCKMEGAQLVCMQWRQDDSMSAYGFTGVRLKFVYSFQGDKIQKALGAPEGPEWPAYSAMSKDATTWMAANRADEWKKVSDEKGGLIRNGQTGPAIMKLAQDYAKTIQIAPAPTDLIGLANAYVAAMNRRDIEAAIALFTDDADYDAGVHSGAGKDRVRTILDYMDGTGMRMAHSDCSVKDAQAVCVQWRQDESMRALGYPGVRLRVTFSFKDGKIQHVAGTPEGPEYAQYIAATKEAMTWMAASRAEAWKKISDDKGALIRNGQTGPAVIKLVQEYANEKAKKGVSQ